MIHLSSAGCYSRGPPVLAGTVLKKIKCRYLSTIHFTPNGLKRQALLEKDVNMSTSFPDLTTAFTPPPACTNWYVSGCTDTDCYVEAFPTGRGICDGDGGTDATTSYACYPKVTLSTAQYANGEAIYTLEVATYSPGLYCPLGMTTASSVPLLDGVFCCPR